MAFAPVVILNAPASIGRLREVTEGMVTMSRDHEREVKELTSSAERGLSFGKSTLLKNDILYRSRVLDNAAPSVQVGFSPEESTLQLVLQTLGGAQRSIRLMGYSFTSPEVAGALVAAKHRGIDVRIVLDEDGNCGNASVAAMNLLATAGIPVRTVSQFKILHDKIIIVDGQTVETGSFNFSRAAARSNSENALVLHDVPDIAEIYLAHWQSRWELGRDWHPAY